LLLGPLRRLLPSPLHSNWRLYLEEEGGLAFIKNVVEHPLYTLGARFGADGLPAHLSSGFTHVRDGGTIRTSIDPGDGSAPDLVSVVEEVDSRALPPGFEPLGETLEDAVAKLVPMRWVDRPLRAVGLWNRTHIDVAVDLASIRPAQVREVHSDWLAPIIEDRPALAFVAPRVRFLSTDETWRPLGER